MLLFLIRLISHNLIDNGHDGTHRVSTVWTSQILCCLVYEYHAAYYNLNFQLNFFGDSKQKQGYAPWHLVMSPHHNLWWTRSIFSYHVSQHGQEECWGTSLLPIEDNYILVVNLWIPRLGFRQPWKKGEFWKFWKKMEISIFVSKTL